MSLQGINNDEQFALFKSVIEFSNDAIITKTLDGIITSWNSAAETLFGFTDTEIIGKHISLIIPKDRVSEELEIISKIKAGQYVKHYETERLRKDGSTVFISLTISPLKDKNGIVIGASKIARDITKQKQEEHHLRLLESVITNTTDAVLITEATQLDDPGPRILYVNEAFTRMTGYSPEEVIGKTPRILQGPKSDIRELKRLGESLRKYQPCEITTINYKKSGAEFWINFTVNPVSDEKGQYTHFIAIERDVTQQKNEELQKSLLFEISKIFNENAALSEILPKVLERLVDFGNFCIAEVWLIGHAKKKIHLTAKAFINNEIKAFFNESVQIKDFAKGEGLPGITWETRGIQYWDHIDENKAFVRKAAAKKAGLKCAYGLPLSFNNEMTGVLVLGLSTDEKPVNIFSKLLEQISLHLGVEIRRKQMEQELNQIFNFAPDIICTAGMDGYFKKINPAMRALTEYTEDELLSTPFFQFIHPADLEKSISEIDSLRTGKTTVNFEVRLITKPGKIKWLLMTATSIPEDEIMFAVAKDITDKKALEALHEKATNLARIGGFDFDLVKKTGNWSAVMKEIHEVEDDFEAGFENGLIFYEGENRELILQKRAELMETGIPFDIEVQIVTVKKNSKWVRIICEVEFSANRIVRLYGSCQDIDARKKAEIAGKKALEERNLILESIDDAFFAVDKNWVVTYWNNKAENVLGKLKHEILKHNLWEVFSDSINSESYKKYH